jgi:SAM-dependent methyltransferase
MLRQWLTIKITRPRLRSFLETQRTSQRVLDVGASANTHTDLFPNVVRGDIRLVAGNELVYDAHHLPFADASLPVVLCTEVLEHCHDPQRVVDECWRVLAPGGRLVLTTRFVFPIHDAPGDYYRYTVYGLRHLLRAYDQVTIQPETTTVETLAVLLQRLIYQAEWRLPGAKIALGLLARLVLASRHLIRAEYGSIQRTQREDHIMASGYYVVAHKPSAQP